MSLINVTFWVIMDGYVIPAECITKAYNSGKGTLLVSRKTAPDKEFWVRRDRCHATEKRALEVCINKLKPQKEKIDRCHNLLTRRLDEITRVNNGEKSSMNPNDDIRRDGYLKALTDIQKLLNDNKREVFDFMLGEMIKFYSAPLEIGSNGNSKGGG